MTDKRDTVVDAARETRAVRERTDTRPNHADVLRADAELDKALAELESPLPSRDELQGRCDGLLQRPGGALLLDAMELGWAEALRLAANAVVRHEESCHKSECPACVLIALAEEMESR